jgi:hypothetical protein
LEEEMSLLAILENGLFALATVLRLPVMVLLWACVAAAVFMAGGALASFLARRAERQSFDVDAWLGEGTVLGASDDRRRSLPAMRARPDVPRQPSATAGSSTSCSSPKNASARH